MQQRRWTRPVNLLSLIVSLSLISACVGQVTGGLLDEAEDQPDVVPEIVNPSGEGMRAYMAMPPCGTVLTAFQGVAAYSNGPNTSTGASCGGTASTGLRYQCPEVVMRYFTEKFGFRFYGNAKDLLANAPGDKTRAYHNGDAAHPPVPGDMLIWDAPPDHPTYPGHVALVVGVTSSAVNVIEQNVKGSGRATLTIANGDIGPRWGNWKVLGWVHAKANTQGANNPNPPPPPNNPNPPNPAPQPATCHSGSPYGWAYCSAACPCNVGEGDCDDDAQCKPGLICAANVGANYGVPNSIDVCQTPSQVPPTNTAPTWNCSKSSYQGMQLWTCKNRAIYHCVNGSPFKIECAYDCNYNPLGSHDTCKTR
ncbi:MAG: CHAP domain-containing protein [Deltaproteobacteria bacterium]|nr:CHAP domain-containing protein [Deltaproteobacteria bacterium]